MVKREKFDHPFNAILTLPLLPLNMVSDSSTIKPLAGT